MYDQKPAEINVTPHPSTRETSGKVQPIRRCLGPTLLDSTSFIGGKCDLSNGSGKSPGLNQFAFCSYGETALAVFALGKKSWETSSYFAQNLSHSRTASNVFCGTLKFSAGRLRRFRGDEDDEDGENDEDL